MRSKSGNYGFKMTEGFMSVFQNILRRTFDDTKLSEIDKIVLRSMFDYCWAWNKLDHVINEGVMDKNMNGHGEFDEIIEKELEWWAKNHKVDLKKVTALKCMRCGTVVDRIEVIRCLDANEEPHCHQCPGQDPFTGKRMKLVPIK